ncbi:MAG: DUF72 domain-containing protein [Planctomycetes bacterium]|nr:DUF72 domain-containing protein [Planctomycetota bacterium]
MEYWIGCSGWLYRDWRGRFYPKTLPQKRWFRDHYARRFRTVELNVTFYRFPTPAMARSWYAQAPAGFRFSLKVHRLITHLKRFRGTARLLRDFYAVGEALEDKMGCFLFQLPARTVYTPENLRRILDGLHAGRRNVVEFRHRSWWIPEVTAAFRRTRTVFCTVSSPGLPDDLVRTSDSVYLRFHGRTQWYRHDYSHEELTAWAGRIRDSGAREAWAYFNNDAEARAPVNAAGLAGLLKVATLPGARARPATAPSRGAGPSP